MGSCRLVALANKLSEGTSFSTLALTYKDHVGAGQGQGASGKGEPGRGTTVKVNPWVNCQKQSNSHAHRISRHSRGDQTGPLRRAAWPQARRQSLRSHLGPAGRARGCGARRAGLDRAAAAGTVQSVSGDGPDEPDSPDPAPWRRNSAVSSTRLGIPTSRLASTWRPLTVAPTSHTFQPRGTSLVQMLEPI